MINKVLGEYGQWDIEILGNEGERIIISDWRDYNKTHEVPASCEFQISIVNGCGLGSGFEAVSYDTLINKIKRCCWIDNIEEVIACL